jgi:hypothetical protein
VIKQQRHRKRAVEVEEEQGAVEEEQGEEQGDPRPRRQQRHIKRAVEVEEEQGAVEEEQGEEQVDPGPRRVDRRSDAGLCSEIERRTLFRNAGLLLGRTSALVVRSWGMPGRDGCRGATT